MDNHLSLTIWDSDEHPNCTKNEIIYRWNGYREEQAFVYSLLQYVDVNDLRLKNKYTAWLFELGKRSINGQSLINHFFLEKNFSYWWLISFIVHNNNNAITTDIIRMLAIEEIILERRPSTLKLVSSNLCLQKVMSTLCHNLNIIFQCYPDARKIANTYRRRSPFILCLTSIGSFCRYIYKHWPLRRVYSKNWLNDDERLFICSYSDNLDQQKLKDNKFYSYYWCDLHQFLNSLNIKIQWMHVFSSSSAFKNIKQAAEKFQKINESNPDENHVFIDSFLSIRVIFSALKCWLQLIFLSFRLKKIHTPFHTGETVVPLWLFLEADWNKSLYGSLALHNLLKLKLFDSALKKAPMLKKGLYLCENQAWERSLIHAWYKYNHGILMGVAHSSVRFWDLRYFLDRRIVEDNKQLGLPLASYLILNNENAFEHYIKNGYPLQCLKRAEALRYNYLALPKITSRKSSEVSILVLGDYSSDATDKLLMLLNTTNQNFDLRKYTIAFKPHPNHEPDLSRYPWLNIKIIEAPLQGILPHFNMVLTSNSTTAAVDAYVYGIFTAILLDDCLLNYSPLKGYQDVYFINSDVSLYQALKKITLYQTEPSQNDYFYVDRELKLWAKLLEN